MIGTEGQPRKIIPFRSLDRLKTLGKPQRERASALTQAPTPGGLDKFVIGSLEERLRVVTAKEHAFRQSWEKNPLLDEAAKAKLRVFDVNEDKAWREYQEMRDREPKSPSLYKSWYEVRQRKGRQSQETAREIHPEQLVTETLSLRDTIPLTFKSVRPASQISPVPQGIGRLEETISESTLPSLSQWEQFKIARQRRRQKEEVNAREKQRQMELEKQQQSANEAAKQAKLEQKRKDELKLGLESCQQLEQEVRSQQFDQIAENIKRSWLINAPGTALSVTMVRHPKVILNDDGTVKSDRSQVGMLLTYSHKGKKGEDLKKYLYFGIGNFDYWDDIEGRDSLPIAELEKGMKSYFIWDYGGLDYRDKRKVVPTISPRVSEKVFDHLYDATERITPEKWVQPQQTTRKRIPAHAAA